MKSVNFGIDLGTTNSLIAKFDSGQVTVFKNPIGHKETLASVVAFRTDRRLVGDKAREYLLKDPVNVFGSFKRKMGTDERYYVVNLDENITPIQLSTCVLQELKNFIHTGEKLEACIVTIPASFDTMQSNATIQAAKDAGINEVFILQEPIAASLAYFNQNKEDHNGYWLVYDLGGGTFDVALVRIDESDLKVIDHEGNNFLGGVDFDHGILDQIIIPAIIAETGETNFEEELKTTYGKYEKLYYQLLYKAEEAKKELSNQEETEIEFDALINNQSFSFIIPVTRSRFEEIIQPAVKQTIDMLSRIIQRNQLPETSIQKIVLVGGSTMIPYVRETLSSTGIALSSDIDPTTAVAVGAAYYAANKYYTPPQTFDKEIDHLLEDIISTTESEIINQSNLTEPKKQLAYNKTSKEEEELLLVKLDEGIVEGMSYRIIRADGGFDTGLVPAKIKFTEFLPLLPGVINKFFLRFFDQHGHELSSLFEEIQISQGQFSISGQPLPKDICIEVDDPENKTTKLELIFEKNSILPQKRTLYRTISKTIKKGDTDEVIINILEGDRYARPISNLVIGCITINGKNLSSDLIKGSDIEIQITMSESRSLNVEVFLVVTQQDFKNTFAVAEKQVQVSRLKEQYFELEQELRNNLKLFSYEENTVWQLQGENLLEDLLRHKKSITQLKEGDKSDTKYIVADTIQRISQEMDKLGGNDRLEQLQFEYFETKEYIEQHLELADHGKDKLVQRYKKILQSEQQLLVSKNASTLERAIYQLNSLGWDIWWNNNGFLITKYTEFKEMPESEYTSYSTAKSIFKLAEAALQQEKFVEFRQHIYSLTHLVKAYKDFKPSKEFTGTGIG